MIKTIPFMQLIFLVICSYSINAQDLTIIVTDVNHNPVQGVKVDVITEYFSITTGDSLPNRFYLERDYLKDLNIEKPDKIIIIVSDLRKGKEMLYESDTSEIVNMAAYKNGYWVKLEPKRFTYDLNIIAVDAETRDTIKQLQVETNDKIAKSLDSLDMRLSLPANNDLLNIDIKHPEYRSMTRYHVYNGKNSDTLRIEMQKNRYRKRIYIRERGEGKNYVNPQFVNREVIVAGPENTKDTLYTNANGMVEFDFLLRGYHEFSIPAIDSFKMEDIHSEFFKVGPEAFDFEDFFFLERKDPIPDIVFKGWLTNDVGLPLDKAKVTINIEGHNDHHLITDKEGFFSTSIAMDKFSAEFSYKLEFEKKYHKTSTKDKGNQFITYFEANNLLVEKPRIELLRTHQSYSFRLENWKMEMTNPKVIFWSEGIVQEAIEKHLDDGVFKPTAKESERKESKKDKPINTIDYKVIGPLDFECIFVVEKLSKNKIRYYQIEKENLDEYLEPPKGKMKRLKKTIYKEYDGLKLKLQYLGMLR